MPISIRTKALAQLEIRRWWRGMKELNGADKSDVRLAFRSTSIFINMVLMTELFNK